jgi:hypothetical protein
MVGANMAPSTDRDSVAGEPKKTDVVSQETKNVLLHSSLMKEDEDGNHVITSEGFQFLLMKRTEQVWYFLTQCLKTVEERLGLDVAACLGFLCQLSFASLGRVRISIRLIFLLIIIDFFWIFV